MHNLHIVEMILNLNVFISCERVHMEEEQKAYAHDNDMSIGRYFIISFFKFFFFFPLYAHLFQEITPKNFSSMFHSSNIHPSTRFYVYFYYQYTINVHC